MRRQPTHIRRKFYATQWFLLPALVGLIILAYALAAKPVGLDLLLSVSIPLMIIGTLGMAILSSWDNLIVRPNVYKKRECGKECSYIIVRYCEVKQKNSGKGTEWQKIRKIFPGLYLPAGEPFNDRHGNFIRASMIRYD